MTSSSTPRYRGIFPVVPTTFYRYRRTRSREPEARGRFHDRRGPDGLCILANFSEQFAITDDERDVLTRTILDHVAGRVPVIVTTSHYSTQVCAARSLRAQQLGAAMVMAMPPYHGATFRVPEAQIFDFYTRVSDAIAIPIMVRTRPRAAPRCRPRSSRGWHARSSRSRTSRSRRRAPRTSCAS